MAMIVSSDPGWAVEMTHEHVVGYAPVNGLQRPTISGTSLSGQHPE